MMSHDLARILLDNDNLPIATHANNHTYAGRGDVISDSCIVALLHHYLGDHIVIGNCNKKDLNGPNEYITEIIHGEDFPKDLNWSVMW